MNAIHHLDRRRSVGEDRRGRLQRLEQIGELDGQHCLELRQRHERIFASTTTASVPSEPTVSLAMLNGASPAETASASRL